MEIFYNVYVYIGQVVVKYISYCDSSQIKISMAFYATDMLIF